MSRQRGLLEQRRARVEHLLFILREEIENDAKREVSSELVALFKNG